MIGLLFIIGWGVQDITGNRPQLRVVKVISASASLLILAIITHTQAGYWRNNLTLFEHTLKVTSSNPFAENFYGCALMEEDRLKEAEPHFRKAFFMDPSFADARNNLCKNLIRQNRLDEAVICYKELLQHGGKSAEIYYNLATLLKMQNKYDEAIQFYNSALATDPNDNESRKKMASIFIETGRLNEAIEQLNKALLSDSNKAEIYVSLGALYYQSGNYEQAIQSWTKAVDMRFNNVEVFNNLAWLLATADNVSAQDAERAIELSRRACEQVGYQRPDFLDTLAAAYAAGGRFDEAIITAQKALEAAKTAGQGELAGKIQNRIKLYQSGQRFLQK
jgi:tetratricopeptide (TPR) repeat protein